ncbi:MAG: ATP-binding cassette domain-containing protein [Bacteroidales bacterium]|nr:ATP-binding cassette domain-containing protein [Bacteroidales bacterium]
MNDYVVLYDSINVYIDKELIIERVNFSIKKGELVYLLGEVGSGKTTFFRSLYADANIEGNIAFVCGYDLLKIKKSQIPLLRRNIGIVFQDFQLLTDRNVYNNLKFVLKATNYPTDQIDARINEVLEKVGMLDKIKKFPSELSGGEQQRIVIARALLNKPMLIIADEPTGNLDPQSANNIMEILNDLAKQECAVIVATHNYNLVEKFPHRMFLFQNRKINEIL